MAPHSAERKARPRPIGLLVVFILAAIVSVPTALILGMVMTPLLWKLEPVLGLELAGHSGPSDWVLLGLAAAFTVGGTALYVWRTRRAAGPTSEPSSGV